MSRDSNKLNDAYRQARYRVLAEPPFVLHIDQHSPELAAWHADYGVTQSAFLTAANPGSRLLQKDENLTRHEHLMSSVDGFPTTKGRGEDPQGHWPDEASLLVGGISLSDARELARRFGQNALLYAGPDARPGLVWTIEETS